MRTESIPVYRWVPFLDEFSRRHQGEPVTLELVGEQVGVGCEAQSLPLVGVSVDYIGNETEQIEVLVGDSTRASTMHAIRRPKAVRVARTDDGQDAVLEIESGDGPRTLLHLRGQRKTGVES